MVDILLMDDDAAFTSVLSEALEHGGHNVTITRSASEALEAINVKKFDILITDIIVFKNNKSVPDGGISLISRLRTPTRSAVPPWAKMMPIIAISGAFVNQGMTEVLRTAQRLGADLALNKPTKIEDLLHAIKVLTKNKRV